MQYFQSYHSIANDEESPFSVFKIKIFKNDQDDLSFQMICTQEKECVVLETKKLVL